MTGDGLLGARAAAGAVERLEDEHLAARPGEVAGGHQPVVATADDDVRRAHAPGRASTSSTASGAPWMRSPPPLPPPLPSGTISTALPGGGRKR